MNSLFGDRQKQSLVVLVLMIAGLIYMANRGPGEQSPEGQVRKAIQALVTGAEDKDIGPFETYLSVEVKDEQGRGKDEILNIMRLIFFRHPAISLSLLDLEVADNTNPDVLSASLTLLMGESPIPSDKANFFLTFRREDNTWRVWEIRWDGGYGY